MPVQGAGPWQGRPTLPFYRAGQVLSREERTGQNQGSFWEQLILNKGLKERKQEWRMQAGAKEAPERRKRIRKEESCERTQPIPAGPELEVTGGKTARDPAKEGSGAGSRRKLCVTTDSVQSVRVQRAPCEPAGAAAAAPERSEGGLRQAEQREQHTHRQTDRQKGTCRGQGGGVSRPKAQEPPTGGRQGVTEDAEAWAPAWPLARHLSWGEDP